MLGRKRSKQAIFKRTKPIAFISYSWDSKKHRDWVGTLADSLSIYGVEVIIDQSDLLPGESVPQFMERSIERADYILTICTPAYARRSNQRVGGVGYEQQIVSAKMARGIKDKKIIPIIRRGTLRPGNNCAVPSHLDGYFAVDMRKDDNILDELDNLARAMDLTQLDRVCDEAGRCIAEIGKRKKYSIMSGRLPSPELDGFRLKSGVESAELYPKTFHIPSEAARDRVGQADIVKLCFELYDSNMSDSFEHLFGERMWVKIQRKRGPYLVGKLMNQPLASDENGWPLKWGDTILFLPEHIIDIE